MRTAFWLTVLVIETLILWPLSFVSEQAENAWTFEIYAGWADVFAHRRS